MTTRPFIRHRLELYHEQTEAVVARYAQRGVLAKVNGTGSVNEVTERVLDSLDRLVGVNWRSKRVEGRPVLKRQPDGSVGPAVVVGSDGITVSSDGGRLYYCPLASRQLYSVATDALVDRSIDDVAVAATATEEGDNGGAGDGLESDAAGYVYATNYEHNAVLRWASGSDGAWETVAHDSRLLWPDTLSLARNGNLYVTANHCIGSRIIRMAKTCGLSLTLFRIRVEAEPVLLH